MRYKAAYGVSAILTVACCQNAADAKSLLLLAQFYGGSPDPLLIPGNPNPEFPSSQYAPFPQPPSRGYPGMQGLPPPGGDILNPSPPNGFMQGGGPRHSFDPNSVRSKDSGTRYLVFEGMTTIWIPAKSATVVREADYGFVKCYGISGYADGVEYQYNPSFDRYGRSCSRYGYRPAVISPAEPAREEQRSYTYEIDCLDRTFDRRKDNLPWKSVADDQTAAMVASRYCRGGTTVLNAPMQPQIMQAAPFANPAGNGSMPQTTILPETRYTEEVVNPPTTSSPSVPEAMPQQQSPPVLAANGLKQISCTPESVSIKFINGLTVCAEPTPTFPQGRYFANGNSLVKLK